MKMQRSLKKTHENNDKGYLKTRETEIQKRVTREWKKISTKHYQKYITNPQEKIKKSKMLKINTSTKTNDNEVRKNTQHKK